MDVLKAILDCLTDREDESTRHYLGINDHSEAAHIEKEEHIAADTIEILFTAEKPGRELQDQLNKIVHTEGWYESLAKRILDQLVATLKARKAMGAAMKAAYNHAYHTAKKFVHEHPLYAAAIFTVVAIGVLVLLVPWVVETLGFGELGPLEGERYLSMISSAVVLRLTIPGSFAAWWQSTFPDAEAGSFFSYLQRLGMKWGRK